MPNIQEILKQIQRDLSCPICGAKFEMKDIKVCGAFEHAVIIQTVCHKGHLTLFMTVLKSQAKPQTPVTMDETLDFNISLNKFDGDFEKLWKK